MVNPSALGVAFLVLLATTTVVGSSPPTQPSFQVAHPSLSDLIDKDPMGGKAELLPADTIHLDQEGLKEPQWLSVQVPEGASFEGTLAVNGEVKYRFGAEGIRLDLKDILALGATDVVLAGSYSPGDGSVVVSFNNSETTVRQQVGQRGQVHYQINFWVD
ncbi:MAG: hypothetical protein ACHWZW_05665 [Spirulina sp.]